MITLNIKIKISTNKIGEGGHLFYTLDKQSHPWLGVWIFKQNNLRKPVSESAFLYYPESNKFEPNKSYITKITLFINTSSLDFFKPGNTFKIQAGILYDNKYWGSGEILELLDEETDKK